MAEHFSCVSTERRALRIADVLLGRVLQTNKCSPSELRKMVYDTAIAEISAAKNDEMERIGLGQAALESHPNNLIAEEK